VDLSNGMVSRHLSGEVFSPYKRRIGFNTRTAQIPQITVEDREA